MESSGIRNEKTPFQGILRGNLEDMLNQKELLRLSYYAASGEGFHFYSADLEYNPIDDYKRCIIMEGFLIMACVPYLTNPSAILRFLAIDNGGPV